MTDYTMHCEGGNYSTKFHLDTEYAKMLCKYWEFTAQLPCTDVTERMDLIAEEVGCTRDDIRDALTMQETNQLDN